MSFWEKNSKTLHLHALGISRVRDSQNQYDFILVGCAQTAAVLDESMIGGMGDLKLWKTRRSLGLEHRKTRVLEGSRMAVDGWKDGRLLKLGKTRRF